MLGQIRCARSNCRTKMEGDTCPKCGGARCFINIYWKGKHHNYWHDEQGDNFYYEKALRHLNAMRLDVDKNRFDPLDFQIAHIKERRVVNKLAEWLDQKKTELDNEELAISTFRHYRAYYNKYYTPYFDKLDCREVQFATLESFKDWLAGKGIKIKTRRNILNALHAFFVWIFQKGIIKTMPAFPPIKGDDATVKTSLDYADQQTYLENIPVEHREVLDFGFEAGLRSGELCALRIYDLDLKTGKAIIQRTLSCGKIRETTKAKNKRPILMSDHALKIATTHAEGRFGQDFVFLNPSTGRGYKTEYLRRLWRKYSKAPVTLNEAMRHSFCTQIVEGDDLAAAQTLLRHADIRSTLAYFHANVTKLSDVVNTRGRVLKLRKRVGNELKTK